MTVKHFVESSNVNDTEPEYVLTKTYAAKASIPTISNVMDVGDPSNFMRMRHIFNNNFKEMEKNLSSYAFNDEQTKETLLKIHKINGYIADPHGAVGYLGLKKYQEQHLNTYGIFLETAHPVKFLDIVEETLSTTLEIPPQIQKVMNK
ncbi:hypothetical protein [Maribacter sp. IgM3_T14_3]|uniref:hypothetical protein n=1 Tax=Maribacter sp. IgM3_T14_3 TaxID=3415140 RepID=UPI003C6F70F6